jgi:hypothetical protein
MRKDDFLSNPSNKQRFLHMLGDQLNDAGCRVYHAVDDADAIIAKVALSKTAEGPTVIIADDTDILVLLLHHHSAAHIHPIYFKPEPRGNSKRKPRIWDIRKAQQILGRTVCEHILFVHAILGCDTTSRLHNKGKAIALKLLKSSSDFVQCADVFQRNSSKEQVNDAGEKALVLIYGGNARTDTLNNIRYRMFCCKTATSRTAVKVRTLPPTSASAVFHSQRVYFQVQMWKKYSGDGTFTMDPLAWGWKLSPCGSYFLPITTDIPAAPPNLLQVIRCTCKTGCESVRCTCRKHGLPCTPSCGNCYGVSCSNIGHILHSDMDGNGDNGDDDNEEDDSEEEEEEE